MEHHLESNKPSDEVAKPQSDRVSANKRKHHDYGGPAKKPRFNKGNISYSKETTGPKSILTTPITTYFPIYTSLEGLAPWIIATKTILSSKDRRFDDVSLDLFQYAAHLCLYNRIYRVAQACGDFRTIVSDDFRVITENLLLPDPICSMIESVGVVQHVSGIKVVPYAPIVDEIGNLGFVNPRSFVTDWDQSEGTTSKKKHKSPLAVNKRAIAEYMNQILRFSGLMRMRKVIYSELTGKDEFLVAYKSHGPMIVPFTSSPMAVPCSQLGASYMWRPVDGSTDPIPGMGNQYVTYPFDGKSFDSTIFMAIKLGDSITLNQGT